MVLKTPFSTVSPIVSSFTFTELVNNQGIISLYGGRLVDDDYLSSNAFYSDSLMTTSANMGGSVASKRLDIDFDIEITKTMVLRGNGIVNVGIGVYRSGSNNSGYVIAKLRKYDGSTETEIASNQSRTWNNNSTVGMTYTYLGIDIDVPETTIVRGDILRLTIELWGAGGADPSYVAFGHDPQNRNETGSANAWEKWDTSGAVPSILKLDLPVRLNV
jgi:hypothetical protein